MSQVMKAVVAEVSLAGDVTIQGLHLPNGSFGVAVSQVAELFSVPQKNSSRELKALMGKDFSFLTTKSELNSKEVKYFTLGEFKKIVLKLAYEGNETAQAQYP